MSLIICSNVEVEDFAIARPSIVRRCESAPHSAYQSRFRRQNLPEPPLQSYDQSHLPLLGMPWNCIRNVPAPWRFQPASQWVRDKYPLCLPRVPAIITPSSSRSRSLRCAALQRGVTDRSRNVCAGISQGAQSHEQPVNPLHCRMMCVELFFTGLSRPCRF